MTLHSLFTVDVIFFIILKAKKDINRKEDVPINNNNNAFLTAEFIKLFEFDIRRLFIYFSIFIILSILTEDILNQSYGFIVSGVTWLVWL